MKVIVVKYKSFAPYTELDITQKLFDDNPGAFKEVTRITAKTSIHTGTIDEEE